MLQFTNNYFFLNYFPRFLKKVNFFDLDKVLLFRFPAKQFKTTIKQLIYKSLNPNSI